MKDENENIDGQIHALCGRENPFRVHDGYFDTLHEQLKSRAGLENMRSEIPDFSVPEGYFDTLSEHIRSRIMLEGAVGNATPFTVPANYFSELEQKLQVKTAQPETAVQRKEPVIRRMFGQSAWKYASAACIVLAATAAVILYAPTNAYSVQNELSALPDSDIESYLQENTGSQDMSLLMENMDHDLAVKPVSQQMDKSVLKEYIETQL